MKRRAFLKLAAGTAALPLFFIGAAAWAGGESWKLGKHATRTGDVVTVDIPAGKVDSGSATCAYDFSRHNGKVFRASIRARGFGVSRPEPRNLGFKFMGTYRDDASGALNYPGAAQVGGDFPWQTVLFTDGNVGVKRALLDGFRRGRPTGGG